MKDFLGNELSTGDKVAFISSLNKKGLEKGIIYSIGEKNRLYVNRGDASYEDLIKLERSQLWNLEFKWNTQVVKL